jgi:Uma2 family endonuclease
MSAEAFGAQLPAELTLDDLAAMAEADGHGHRYELSPEGVLSIMPPPDVEHAMLASQLAFWLAAHGWPPERVLQVCGLRIETDDGVGGRIPDLTVWSQRPSRGAVWATTEGLALVVEIVSKSTEAIDKAIKKDEYARAGIPRYWLVNRDAGNTVTMWTLDNGLYRQAGSSSQPLAWLLNTDPKDHLG